MRRLITTALLICATIAACAAVCGFGTSVPPGSTQVPKHHARDANVPVFVNSRKTKLNPPAIMRDGKAYVGLRGVAKALHASARWNEKSRIAIVTVGNKRIRVAQGKGITLNGVLFLPLRATGEAVGCTVEWDRAQRAIKITTEAPCPIGGG